uniref:Uncharacterized protein n=1 Tax=Ditylenchus dipsaci TaxID=166011 RepID=A0A915E271_9BILA
MSTIETMSLALLLLCIQLAMFSDLFGGIHTTTASPVGDLERQFVQLSQPSASAFNTMDQRPIYGQSSIMGVEEPRQLSNTYYSPQLLQLSEMQQFQRQGTKRQFKDNSIFGGGPRGPQEARNMMRALINLRRY